MDKEKERLIDADKCLDQKESDVQILSFPQSGVYRHVFPWLTLVIFLIVLVEYLSGKMSSVKIGLTMYTGYTFVAKRAFGVLLQCCFKKVVVKLRITSRPQLYFKRNLMHQPIHLLIFREDNYDKSPVKGGV
uniref:Uncharacterized protein n=1 Tax=Glossina brevipalpis TaxID=37001 RepID=A0A1A9W1E8_9MUSC